MSPTAQRVKRHRAKLQAEGLRPVQLWAPDTRDPKFIAACRRQSLALMTDPAEKDILDWIDQAADTAGWK